MPGAFGSRGAEGKINCVRYARENKVPYLGLCYGFQMATIEFARHVCGLADANSTEIDPHCTHPVIDILPEQKAIERLGGNMRLGGQIVEVKSGTMAAELYGTLQSRERFRHRWECNPQYLPLLQEKGLIFSGKAPESQIMQILELPNAVHPFFLGTQFHPEYSSKPLQPHPFFTGFIRAASEMPKFT